jgi:imidazolonepropionase-like amidohydrolase
MRTSLLALAALAAPMLVGAQSPQGSASARALSPAVKAFVSVDAPVVALTHVRLVDGTGTPAKDDQTIVIEGETIRAVGKTGSVAVPAGAQVMDLTGHTVVPGIVGLHDHMYYSSPVTGSMKIMPVSYPKLFLAAGVTTIRTTGSVDPYQELNLKAAITAGQTVGPEIFVTGPYLQGPQRQATTMHPLRGGDEARRLVRYWAQEGVTWFKAYTTITREQLGAAIDEAHRNGVKVTAHLCSVSYREAVALGIDALEHGLFANTDFTPGKVPDQCPTGGATDSVYANLDVASAAVQQTIREMIARNVALTSTLAVYELSAPSRVPVDQRVLDALHPDAAKFVSDWYTNGRTANDSLWRRAIKKGMAFEREFVKAGGLLGAGADPCCVSAIAGYADQRNYELLVEAGFTPEQAVQVMTSNGAKILGIADRVGTLSVGKQADLLVLRGDPTRSAGDIRNVVTTFRKGVGYDAGKLTAAVKGQIGLK